MAKFNLIIADNDNGSVTLESQLVEGDLDGKPTPAMIVMAFLGAHAPDLCVEAVRWAKGVVERQAAVNRGIDEVALVVPGEKQLVLPS